MSSIEPEAPPSGEQIHLPGPSLLPLLLAVGLTIALVGVTTSIILVVAGSILSIVVIVKWIRSTMSDMDELPLDEH